MRAIKLFIFLGLTILGSSSGLDPEKLQMIEDLIQNLFIPQNNVTGMGLSVLINGEVALSKGYAKSDIENDIDAANNTLFSIGSITKSFMGVLVVKILSEKFPDLGEQVLDVPIIALEPNFNITFSDRFRAEHTSFRDMLSHRTCLLHNDMELIFGSMKSIGEYSYRNRYLTEDCGHRTGYRYNNRIFALIGELIASFEGIPLEQLIRSFMRDIGMQDATTIDASASYLDLPNMSQSYYQLNGQIHKFNSGLLRRIDIGVGAGGILASANDMVAYANFHLNKGKVGDRQIVSAEALSWMYTVSNPLSSLQAKMSDSDGRPSGTYGYGLGFDLALYNGYPVITHGGYWPPYHAGFYIFPTKNIGIFFASNGPGALLASPYTHDVVATTIFDIINDPSKVNLEQNVKNHIKLTNEDIDNAIQTSKMASSRASKLADIEKPIPKYTKIEFDDVLGFYGDELVGDMTITLDPVDESFLQMNIGEWGIGRLVPVAGSETLFSIGWKTNFMHHWYTYPTEVLPVPSIQIELQPPTHLHLLMDGQVIVVFKKNASIDTFPVIPWDPTSCGPTPP